MCIYVCVCVWSCIHQHARTHNNHTLFCYRHFTDNIYRWHTVYTLMCENPYRLGKTCLNSIHIVCALLLLFFLCYFVIPRIICICLFVYSFYLHATQCDSMLLVFFCCWLVYPIPFAIAQIFSLFDRHFSPCPFSKYFLVLPQCIHFSSLSRVCCNQCTRWTLFAVYHSMGFFFCFIFSFLSRLRLFELIQFNRKWWKTYTQARGEVEKKKECSRTTKSYIYVPYKKRVLNTKIITSFRECVFISIQCVCFVCAAL